MIDWPKIHLLEARLAWHRGTAGRVRRHLLNREIAGQRAHHWKKINEARHNKAGVEADEKEILKIRAELVPIRKQLDAEELEIHRLMVAINQLKPKVQMWPMGGWVRPGESYRWQRSDQGQDFEIPLYHSVVAPGAGYCVEYSADREFPNGFGNPYAIVHITTGSRFAGETWYIGHANEPIIRPGQRFVAGQPLARLNHFLDWGWGWVEIGKWDGGPHGMGEGANQRWRFAPLWR